MHPPFRETFRVPVGPAARVGAVAPPARSDHGRAPQRAKGPAGMRDDTNGGNLRKLARCKIGSTKYWRPDPCPEIRVRRSGGHGKVALSEPSAWGAVPAE